MQRLFYKLELI